MQVELNTENIDFPESDTIMWKWSRILCSLDYVPLYPPTSLQWAILSVIVNNDVFKSNLHIEKIAENLGVEKRIIEEGLDNLIESQYISLQARKNKEILQNYTASDLVQELFTFSESVPGQKSHRKIFLFYKSPNKFSYQLIDHPKEKEEFVDTSIDFSISLSAIIDQLCQDLLDNPDNLVKSINLVFNSKNSENLLANSGILIQNVNINFL